MVITAPAEISRRQFLAAACLVPRGLCAQKDDLVEHALKEATTAKVTVQNLRRNISVLYGAGGNVGVLTGPDGRIGACVRIKTRLSCCRITNRRWEHFANSLKSYWGNETSDPVKVAQVVLHLAAGDTSRSDTRYRCRTLARD